MSISCNHTFYDYLGQCPSDAIYINAPFTSGHVYYWKITDKFGNEYVGQSTCEDAARLGISTTGLPEGLLNKYAGSFLLEVYKDEALQQRVPLLMSKYYDGLTFDVRHNTSEKDGLGAVKNDSWC